MEQKDYKLEIVGNLLKSKNHIRGLAKELGTNHMKIQRKIKELEKENVLDYKLEGKNKMFFIKQNMQARNYIFMEEKYKLIQLLRKHPEMEILFGEILKIARGEMIILFGSYAKGNEKKNSDIDIYAETTNTKIKKKIEEINSRINVKIGEFEAGSCLIQEIIKNHVIINGVEKFYEKSEILK